MCGVAGTYSNNGFFEERDIHAMTDALAHRGPDAAGYFTDGAVHLGHRRLSIIDLSTRSNQPMFSQNQRYVMVYNGEVYNYNEIAIQLQSNKISGEEIVLKTSGDSEVVLEAFVKYGVDFVKFLNGMFLIAIYDKVAQELYIFRDRIGIKPLFYYWDGKNFAFASELKSLLKVEHVKKEINQQAVKLFLNLGYIPAPQTIYRNIFKMKSGHWIKVNKDGLVQNAYWQLPRLIKNETIGNLEEAMVKLSDLIVSSVQYQLRSDVPSGVFLSGGIDSSMITATAVMLSALKVNSFSIGFEESSHNEAQYAKKIAEFLGTNHHEFIVSYKDAISLFDSILDAYDEPYADSSSIPTMLVSKLARQHVTVTLSGDGGDELFFGYGSYKWAKRLDSSLIYAARKPLAGLLSLFPQRYKRVGKLVNAASHKNIEQHIFSQEQYFFSDQELSELLNEPYLISSRKEQEDTISNFLSANNNMFDAANNLNFTRNFTAMEKQALFDLQYYLQDDLLTKVDRASMKYSLETRVPFLDHRIIEFALNLSPELKYRNGVSKYILKKILYQYVPEELFNRPKQGFAIPLSKWLKTDLKYLIDDYLNESVIKKYNVVNYQKVKAMVSSFNSGTEFLYNRLWVLIVLHKWFTKNAA
ncbi:MAG TPA: asparagine synthase (glutamine-hydrolyzing) [Bacteroidia bacterium]|nr:asparagine synthase (glutamine-hydrolyzing) [Bacteroidia bacterium]HNU33607.1 asparagine synthase (glutamine-hydrolyzing) [Bacteroidia bacterium]